MVIASLVRTVSDNLFLTSASSHTIIDSSKYPVLQFSLHICLIEFFIPFCWCQFCLILAQHSKIRGWHWTGTLHNSVMTSLNINGWFIIAAAYFMKREMNICLPHRVLQIAPTIPQWVRYGSLHTIIKDFLQTTQICFHFCNWLQQAPIKGWTAGKK